MQEANPVGTENAGFNYNRLHSPHWNIPTHLDEYTYTRIVEA